MDLDLIQGYEDLLHAHAPRINLVSQEDLDRVRERHIDDSLRLLPLLDGLLAGPCADVGSGAGLPGIPLAIAGPERLWHLIEPRRRRAAFLELVVRELSLPNVEVVVTTAEEAAGSLGPVHALVVARALAQPVPAFGLMLPLVAPGGLAAYLTGSDAELPSGAEEWEKGLAIVRVSAR